MKRQIKPRKAKLGNRDMETTPSRHHVMLDDEVPRSMLDSCSGDQAGKVAIERVVWFAGAIAQLALDYRGTHSAGYADKLFINWLKRPNPQLANQQPAIVVWRDGEIGFRKVSDLMVEEAKKEMRGRQR